MSARDTVNDEMYEDGEESEGGESRGLTAKKGRATPSRRTQEVVEVKDEGNFITRPLYGLRDYIEGVRAELAKVVWPTREETRRLTTIVLIVCVVSSIVLGTISALFTWLISVGLETPTIVFGTIFLVALVGFGFYLRQANRRTSSF
ncbi:MAG: preprotein translocase subunit SecE [Anaerolineae bacterium]